MQIFFRFVIAFLLIMNVNHVTAQGLKLFSPEQREMSTPSQIIIMNFLERYFNELPQIKHTTVSTKMADDKVYFRNGSQSDLSQITDSLPFSIKLSYRYYEVEWKKQEKPFITIVFPAQYDLLLGMQQDEAQHKLKETILNAPCRNSQNATPKGLIMLKDSVYMLKTGYLEMKSFNDATYYKMMGDSIIPYFNATHPDYSVANLFHGLILDADYPMNVEQSVYGLKTINYNISLRQWVNYCAAWGLNIYFGVEEQLKDGLLVLVIAQSVEFGFNHMLSVIIPYNFIENKNAVFKAKMTSYIPTHNVKNLFYKESINRRKMKWK